MNTSEVIGLVKDLIPILAIIIGALLSVFVYFQHAPILSLKITPKWVDNQNKLLLVQFEVENKSKVRLHSPEGRIQMLEYPILAGATWPQWVPFKEGATPKSGEVQPAPIQWREPVAIFNTTKYIFPGETIVLERLYHVPQDAIILHFGLQVKTRLGVIGRILTRKSENWSQTATCFAVKTSEGRTSSDNAKAKFEAALAKVADVEPDEQDKL